MRVSKRPASTVGVDLSPMLDVIFQLILFFLVSTTFANLPGISVNLPDSTTAQGTDVSGITITMEADGNIYFNEENVSLETLALRLSEYDVGDHPKDTYPVTIAADDLVTNGNIIKVFDALRLNGFSAVSLRTNTK